MTWMIIRLVLCLAFIGAVLLYASRLAQKCGLGGTTGVIEVVARQRMGRTSSVSVLKVAGRVLVVGATEEQVTLLAEVDPEAVDAALAAHRPPARLHAAPAAGEEGGGAVAVAARPTSSGALAGSVFDRAGWGTFVNTLRERTVRRQ